MERRIGLIKNFKIFEYETTGRTKTLRYKDDDELQEVVGLPSGQIIYMTKRQIKWFNARGLIMYITRYKMFKPGTALNRFCFDDKEYNTIQQYIEEIQW
jgi:hypothetical protein